MVEGDNNSSIKDGDIILSSTNNNDIEFKNVWFKYPNSGENQWVLRGFSLKIESGEWVGVVGESGWGKSTLTQLLFRFYDVQSGSISVGGIWIKDLTLKSLRGNLGIVEQEPILLNWSIMENIIYGKPEAKSEEIVEAAGIGNACEFINKLNESNLELNPNEVEDKRYGQLPLGYQASWGARGSKLSGGQKQRIAIARTIIRKPQILILDEATSALDLRSQEIVQNALDKAMKKCTSIVIAHRQSTLKNWDRIITIEDGIVVHDT